MSTLAFDEREWLRDELIARADDWLTARAIAQADEVRRMIAELQRLGITLELRSVERARIDDMLVELKEQLAELRRTI